MASLKEVLRHLHTCPSTLAGMMAAWHHLKPTTDAATLNEAIFRRVLFPLPLPERLSASSSSQSFFRDHVLTRPADLIRSKRCVVTDSSCWMQWEAGAGPETFRHQHLLVPVTSFIEVTNLVRHNNNCNDDTLPSFITYMSSAPPLNVTLLGFDFEEAALQMCSSSSPPLRANVPDERILAAAIRVADMSANPADRARLYTRDRGLMVLGQRHNIMSVSGRSGLAKTVSSRRNNNNNGGGGNDEDRTAYLKNVRYIKGYWSTRQSRLLEMKKR
eukprot:PhM_4_TR16394/c0_g1_i3/m.88292